VRFANDVLRFGLEFRLGFTLDFDPYGFIRGRGTLARGRGFCGDIGGDFVCGDFVSGV
jgi:hypothetical protein